ncbi:MAG: hypothetical protein ACXW14_12555, partial [Burkholderiaceae bacterium]
TLMVALTRSRHKIDERRDQELAASDAHDRCDHPDHESCQDASSRLDGARVLVAIFAFAFLGERPSPREWTGIAMVAGGVLLLAFKR